jgi:hypothetical protein
VGEENITGGRGKYKRWEREIVMNLKQKGAFIFVISCTSVLSKFVFHVFAVLSIDITQSYFLSFEKL